MLAQNTFTIFRGDAKTIYLKAMNAGCNSDPLDLTSCTEIDLALPNADGTFTHLLKSEGNVVVTSPAVLGKFTAPISSDNSILLQPGEFQNLDITFTIAGKIFTVPFFQALSVFERG